MSAKARLVEFGVGRARRERFKDTLREGTRRYVTGGDVGLMINSVRVFVMRTSVRITAVKTT